MCSATLFLSFYVDVKLFNFLISSDRFYGTAQFFVNVTRPWKPISINRCVYEGERTSSTRNVSNVVLFVVLRDWLAVAAQPSRGTSVSEFWPGPKFLRFELVDEGQPYFLTANRPTNDWGPSSLKCSSGTPCDEHCCLWKRSEERCRYISTSSSSIASAACRHIDCSRATRCVYQRYILILGSQRHKSQPARSAAQLNSLIDGLEGGVRRTGNPRR